MSGKYDDIINLPHHVSNRRPQMSRYDRAAQFAPFAALTGHDAAIRETARLTDRRVELDENVQAELNDKLCRLRGLLGKAEPPQVRFTYFRADEKKSGGAYVTVTGAVRKLDEYARVIVMADGRRIAIDDVVEIGEIGEIGEIKE
jgi:hypothetical protein